MPSRIVVLLLHDGGSGPVVSALSEVASPAEVFSFGADAH